MNLQHGKIHHSPAPLRVPLTLAKYHESGKAVAFAAVSYIPLQFTLSMLCAFLRPIVTMGLISPFCDYEFHSHPTGQKPPQIIVRTSVLYYTTHTRSVRGAEKIRGNAKTQNPQPLTQISRSQRGTTLVLTSNKADHQII